MKTGITAMPLLTLAAAMLVGCTTTRTQTAQQPPTEMHTIQSDYTQHDLERSGQAQTGSALRHIDPDVR